MEHWYRKKRLLKLWTVKVTKRAMASDSAYDMI
jgi:hypothetical protein